MAKRKRILITRENVHEFSRLKKVQDIEYRVVCGKDIITGEEAIHIAPSKNTLHEEIMMEMIKQILPCAIWPAECFFMIWEMSRSFISVPQMIGVC